MNQQSSKKSNLPTVISITIALMVLIFGNNLYERYTGHPLFPQPVPTIISTTAIVTPTSEMPTATATLLSTPTHTPATMTNTPTPPIETPTPLTNVVPRSVVPSRVNPCVGEDVKFDGNNVIVNKRGNCHIVLTEGEVIAGTADRFQDDVEKPEQPQPPCTAFVIRGPYKIDIKIWYGGWNYHSNIFDDKIVQGYLTEKLDELNRHDTCPSRGINTVQLP